MKEIINPPYGFFKQSYIFPKTYYNKIYKEEFENGEIMYVVLVHTNPETFEYGAICTTIQLKLNVYQYKTKTFSGCRFYISTVDDSCMNISFNDINWLYNQDPLFKHKYLKWMQSRKTLVSCSDAYDELCEIFPFLPKGNDICKTNDNFWINFN